MNHSHDSLLNTIRAAIMRDTLLEPGQRVVAAVSGGADSTALLHALVTLGHPVEAAHFDHHTRQGESARDAEFVRDMAAELGVPFHAGGADVAADAREAGRSFEDQARRARYAFLRGVAEKTGCNAVALGHHRDDQAETVLLRLLRGTAGRGLAGMLPVRMEGNLRIVRPLLDCTHGELCHWLRKRGIAWREDATNADPDHARRNRVRHELLPALAREFNPCIHDALASLAHAQRFDNALLEELLDRECARLGLAPDIREEISIPLLLSMHPALRRRWWVRQFERVGAKPAWAHINAADHHLTGAKVGERMDLGRGVFLYRGRGTVSFAGSKTEERAEDAVLAVPGETAALDRMFRVTVTPAAALPPGGARVWCNATRQVFDAARIPGVLRVRTRRPGDRFRPLGMNGTRKLQDYFVDRGVPQPLRDKVPLVTADDAILWVVGHAPSADAAVTAETEQLLQVEVRHAGE
jgi:tRNA(Ile)-lysidine synthase